MIPPIYQSATLRAVLPANGKKVAFALNVGADVIRVALPWNDARELAELLVYYGVAGQLQSLKSSGNENCDGLPHEGQ